MNAVQTLGSRVILGDGNGHVEMAAEVVSGRMEPVVEEGEHGGDLAGEPERDGPLRSRVFETLGEEGGDGA